MSKDLTLMDKIRLLAKAKSAESQIEEGIRMKNSTKVVTAVIGLLMAVAQTGAVQTIVTSAVHTHPGLAAALTGIAAILALLHVPSDQP